MNVFVHELRQNLRALLLWALGAIFMLAATVAKTSGATGANGQTMEVMVALLPKPIANLFGLNMVDFSDPVGIFAIVSVYLALILAYHASGLGASTFAREERDRTFEFLYVRGRARLSIIIAKILAGFVMILALCGVTYAAGGALFGLIEGVNIWARIQPMMGALLVIQLLCYSLGLIISLLTRRMQLGTAIASSTVMALFLWSMFASLVAPDGVLARLSPFYWFDGKNIYANGLSMGAVAIWSAVTLIFIAWSCALHQVRDLQT